MWIFRGNCSSILKTRCCTYFHYIWQQRTRDSCPVLQWRTVAGKEQRDYQGELIHHRRPHHTLQYLRYQENPTIQYNNVSLQTLVQFSSEERQLVVGLASISVWSRSDRREYSAITCDQRYEWSRSISTASLAASVPTTADVAVVNCVGHLPKMPRHSTVSGLGGGKGGSHEPLQRH